jgi:hypothetical protein
MTTHRPIYHVDARKWPENKLGRSTKYDLSLSKYSCHRIALFTDDRHPSLDGRVSTKIEEFLAPKWFSQLSKIKMYFKWKLRASLGRIALLFGSIQSIIYYGCDLYSYNTRNIFLFSMRAYPMVRRILQISCVRLCWARTRKMVTCPYASAPFPGVRPFLIQRTSRGY